MVDVPWDDVFDPTGAERNFLVPLVRPIMNGFCQITSQNPWLLTPMGREMRNFICRPPAPPIAPGPTMPPLPGGQCCTVYELKYRTKSGTTGQIGNQFTSLLNGRVVGPYWRPSVGAADRFSGSWIIEDGHSCPGRSVRVQSFSGGQNLPMMPELLVDSFRRSDGQPDTCGDGIPVFPIPNPVPPVFNFPVRIPIGGVEINTNVTIPVLQPEVNINIRPEITLNLPDFNLTFNFDGITVTAPPGGRNPVPNQPPRWPQIPDANLPPAPNRPPVQPPVQPNAPGRPTGGGSSPAVDLSPVLNAIANVDADLAIVGDNVELLLDCDRCDRRPPEECTKGLRGSGQSMEFFIDKSVKWIGLELEPIPVSAKRQSGVVAPDVIYAGWYEFGGGGCNGDRQPVHYRDNIFPALEGASKFSFTLYSGFRARCYLYTTGGSA